MAMGKKGKFRASSLRIVVEVLVIGVFVVGLFLQTGTGSLSATGVWDVFALCPLGALTSFVASKTFIPAQVVGLVLFIAFVLVLGRVFCAWACPAQLWYKLLNRRDDGSRKREEPVGAACGDVAALNAAQDKKPRSRVLGAPKPSLRGGVHDSRNWMLFGAIVAALVVAFPVFCLICPIGLTFATIVSLWNFLNFNTFGPGLVVFPLILIFELIVLRKWCHTLCPLGALLSWIARGNKTFVPTCDESLCLHEAEHAACHRCVDVCPEEINLHDAMESAPLHQCTKCHLCAEACPTSAITFPFLPKKGDAKVADEAALPVVSSKND